MQGKHYKSKGLKRKIVAPVLAAALLVSTAIPAITTGFHQATAASVDDDSAVAASNVYTAPVNSSNSANNNLYWANATYYDYLSDAELASDDGWLNTVKAGTGFNGSVDEWYPYYYFNRNVVKKVADQNAGWSTPLYFGNFCNTSGAYDTSGHHNGTDNGYVDATGSYNVTRFNYPANNSNGLSNYNESYQGLMRNTLDANGNLMTPNGTPAPYFNDALLSQSFVDDQNVTHANRQYAKIVNSKFPFTQETRSLANGRTYTYYEFNSTNAEDNVYFTWNGKTPTAVNYGAGVSYGVMDGIQYFMNPAEGHRSGYGIFPFNNRSGVGQQSTGTRYIYLSKDNINWGSHYCYFFNGSGAVGKAWPGYQMSTYDGSNNVRVAIPAGATSIIFNNGSGAQTGNITDITKGAYWLESNLTVHTWDTPPADAGTSGGTSNNENLDYGFGIKTSMHFRVPKYGTLDGTANGQPVTFEYSGDDDLWVYITDQTTGVSQLVLDLGGNHKQSEGIINFKTKVATASKVYNGRTNVTKSFNFDDTHTYEMTVFYMERGMLESNCKIAFTMVPLGSEVTVTERIDTTYINPGLRSAVAGVDRFTFTPKAGPNGTSSVSGLNYIGEGIPQTMNGSFTLGSGGAAYFNNAFTINDKINFTQSQTTQSYLTYNRHWDYYDKVGSQGSRSGTAASTDTKTLINSTSNPDPYEFAALQADFVNTPQSAPVSVSKEVSNATNADMNVEFGATVTVQLKDGEAFKPYPLTYTASDLSGTYTLSSTGQLANAAKLKHGRTLTFTGMPKGAHFQVIEDDIPAGYAFESISGVEDITTNGGWATVGDGTSIVIGNTPPLPESGTGTLTIHKTVEGENYNGNLFTYIAEPRTVSATNAGGRTFVTKNSDARIITNRAVEGNVTFNLTFNAAGWYRYRISEDVDKLFLDGLEDQGYKGDVTAGGTSTKYYAEFEVVSDPTTRKLVMNGTPKYYSDANCTREIPAITITNTVKPAEITVMKTNQNNEGLNDTQFMVVKVAAEEATADYDTKINSMLNGMISAEFDGLIQEDVNYFLGTTETVQGVDGVLKFSNLPIYQNGDNVYDLSTGNWVATENTAGGTLAPQTYMVFEYSPKNGYNKNKMVKFVTFPYEDQFAITFDEFMNIAVIQPASGGFAQVFLPVGAGVLGGSLLLAGAYVLSHKKRRAKRKVRHGRRFE